MAPTIKSILIVILSVGTIFAAPTLDDLKSKIQNKISEVDEFSALATEGEKYGLRVFLMGGLASSFSFYTLKNLEKKEALPASGDSELADSTAQDGEDSPYRWNNIFWPSQDIDLAISRIDGKPETKADFEKVHSMVRSIFRDKKVDVFGFQTSQENRPSLFGSSELQNQNSDSVSSGLIELTGNHDILDFKDNSLGFLKSLINKKIEFLRSESHHQTSRAKKGENPEILSVIRFFINSIRYSLEPLENGSIQEIVNAFDPRKIKSTYVKSWIENNAKKLLIQADDFDFLSRIKKSQDLLFQKLIQISGSPQKFHSLAWYLTRTLLTSDPKNISTLTKKLKASGKTAKDLGIQDLAHATSDLENYIQVTHPTGGKPNFIVSINDSTQAARFGAGVYFLKGTKGAGGHYHIQVELLPDAQEGIDFRITGNIVLVFNREKLRLKPDLESNLENLIALATEPTSLETIDADLELLASRMNMRAFSQDQILEIRNAFFKIGAERGYFKALQFLDLFSSPPLRKLYNHAIESGRIAWSKKSHNLLLKTYSLLRRISHFSLNRKPLYYTMKATRLSMLAGLATLIPHAFATFMASGIEDPFERLLFLSHMSSNTVSIQLLFLSFAMIVGFGDLALLIQQSWFNSKYVDQLLNSPDPDKAVSLTTYDCLRLVKEMKWFKKSSRNTQ